MERFRMEDPEVLEYEYFVQFADYADYEVEKRSQLDQNEKNKLTLENLGMSWRDFV